MFNVNLSDIFHHSSSDRKAQLFGIQEKEKEKKKKKHPNTRKDMSDLSDSQGQMSKRKSKTIRSKNECLNGVVMGPLASLTRPNVNQFFIEEDTLAKSGNERLTSGKSGSESDAKSKMTLFSSFSNSLKVKSSSQKIPANLENDYFTTKSRINIDLMSKRKGIKREHYHLINKQFSILLAQKTKETVSLEFYPSFNSDPQSLVKSLIYRLKEQLNMEKIIQETMEQNKSLIKENTHLKVELERLQKVHEVSESTLDESKKKTAALQEKVYELKRKILGLETNRILEGENQHQKGQRSLEESEKELELEKQRTSQLKKDKEELEKAVLELNEKVDKLINSIKIAQRVIGPGSFKSLFVKEKAEEASEMKKQFKCQVNQLLIPESTMAYWKKSKNEKEVNPGNKETAEKFLRICLETNISCTLVSFLDYSTILRLKSLSKSIQDAFAKQAYPDLLISSRLKIQIEELGSKYRILEATVNLNRIFDSSDESMQELLSKYLGAKTPYKVGNNLVQSLKELNSAITQAIKAKNNTKKPPSSSGNAPPESGGAFVVFQSLFTKTHEVINNSAGSFAISSSSKNPGQLKEGTKAVETTMRTYFLVDQNKNQSKALEAIVGYMADQKIEQVLDQTVSWNNFKALKKAIISKNFPDLPQKVEIPSNLLTALVDACEFSLVEMLEMSEMSVILVDEYQKAVLGLLETDKKLEEKINELIKAHFNFQILKKSCNELETENIQLRKTHNEREEKLGPMEIELTIIREALKSTGESLEESTAKLKLMIKEVKLNSIIIEEEIK